MTIYHTSLPTMQLPVDVTRRLVSSGGAYMTLAVRIWKSEDSGVMFRRTNGKTRVCA